MPPLNSLFDGLGTGADLSGLGAHRLAAFWHDLRRRNEHSVVHHKVILEREPTDLGALASVVSHLRHEGRQHEALETARRALAVEPDHFLALRYAACSAAKLGLYDEAKDYVECAMKVAPDFDDISIVLKVVDGLAVAVRWSARLLRRRGSPGSAPDLPSVQVSHDMKEWTQWAHEYLAWHAKRHGTQSGKTRA